MTIGDLHQRGQAQSQTARFLGVSGSALRDHLRRARRGTTDGRQRPSLVEQRDWRAEDARDAEEAIALCSAVIDRSRPSEEPLGTVPEILSRELVEPHTDPEAATGRPETARRSGIIEFDSQYGPIWPRDN